MLHRYCNQLSDFLCVMQFTFLLDDIGIPKDYRHMDGFGVHTFKLINKAGKETFVKFHWKTQQGVPDKLNIRKDDITSHCAQDLAGSRG